MIEPTICPDCKHEISRHGSEGCDVELGDTYVEGLYGAALMAQGPCGCSAVTVEMEEVKQ